MWLHLAKRASSAVLISIILASCSPASERVEAEQTMQVGFDGNSTDLVHHLRVELQDSVFLCNDGHGAGAGITAEQACALVAIERAKLESLIHEIDAGEIVIPE